MVEGVCVSIRDGGAILVFFNILIVRMGKLGFQAVSGLIN